jgi:hypothetical protein
VQRRKDITCQYLWQNDDTSATTLRLSAQTELQEMKPLAVQSGDDASAIRLESVLVGLRLGSNVIYPFQKKRDRVSLL